MKRPALPAAAALGLLATGAAAQTPPGTMSLHDFAARWMMQQDDIADVGRHAAANAALLASDDARPRLLLMGDSITLRWTGEHLPDRPDLHFVNRGIAGQNSSQMLLRFIDDVVALRPRAVVIMAGTNDLRVHAGPLAPAAPAILARLRRNLTAMADIAAANGIELLLCRIPPFAPAAHPNRDPATWRAANDWIAGFAAARGIRLIDYAPALARADGTLDATLGRDGLHPDAAGYERMKPILAAAIADIGTNTGMGTGTGTAGRR